MTESDIPSAWVFPVQRYSFTHCNDLIVIFPDGGSEITWGYTLQRHGCSKVGYADIIEAAADAIAHTDEIAADIYDSVVKKYLTEALLSERSY